MKSRENNARQLLLALGMGQYNATMAVPYMFIAPAATDPAMPQVMLMTKHLQQGLRAAGAPCPVTGVIDDATARCLQQLLGSRWNQKSWFELYDAVIRAKRTRALETAPLMDLGLVPDLPEIPGGILTLAIGAGVAYYLLRKKK
jgi:hypothetical protein